MIGAGGIADAVHPQIKRDHIAGGFGLHPVEAVGPGDGKNFVTDGAGLKRAGKNAIQPGNALDIGSTDYALHPAMDRLAGLMNNGGLTSATSSFGADADPDDGDACDEAAAAADLAFGGGPTVQVPTFATAEASGAAAGAVASEVEVAGGDTAGATESAPAGAGARSPPRTRAAWQRSRKRWCRPSWRLAKRPDERKI